jgi:hypothetical protein
MAALGMVQAPNVNARPRTNVYFTEKLLAFKRLSEDVASMTNSESRSRVSAKAGRLNRLPRHRLSVDDAS